MANPFIGFVNSMVAASVSASGEHADGPAENAADWRLDDHWQPAAAGTSHWIEFDFGADVTCDFLGVFSSDYITLGGTTVSITYGASAAPATSAGSVNPTASTPRVIVDRFTEQTARYWRVTFATASAQPKFQIVILGQATDLPSGQRPGSQTPYIAQPGAPSFNESEDGAIIGAGWRAEPSRMRLSLSHLTEAWSEATLLPFLEHIIEKPAFFHDNEAGDAGDNYYSLIWHRDGRPLPAYRSNTLLAADLDLVALQ